MDAPASTYRLQLHGGFTFHDAAQVVDYLARLGVGAVYCSPILQAAPGSVHGYDVVDHGRLSAEAGGETGWGELVTAAQAAGIGLVVDVVPNHMAVPEPESLNAPLWSLLREGPTSPYAEWFDVDWTAQDGRLLLPVLGAPLGELLERGELAVHAEGPEPVLRYHSHVFPLAPGTGDEPLPALLERQHYRLAYWRTAGEELNYRRFFDVTSLIAVRVESPEVFAASHQLLLELVERGEVCGLRIDHPDGLADPPGYLQRLAAATGGRWVVVEKILEADEQLPRDWATAGTTGYDALNQVLGVLTDPAGEQPLTDIYTQLTGSPAEFATVAEQSKRLVVRDVLAAEVNRLVEILLRLARRDPMTRDMTRRWLHEAVVELLVAFPVYRAYGGTQAGAEQVAHAAAVARSRRPDRSSEIDWIASLALAQAEPGLVGEFATRFAQTSGPVMAKGVEDTAFYRYLRLSALNEVGGDPGRFGVPVEEFHRFCARIARDWPATMTTLSTHDTKRSEDVRARLLVLSEMPVQWGEAVAGWRARAHFHDPNIEYLFWQSLVGAWPIDAHRLGRYLEKASREAKQHTSWTTPDPDYDAALQQFVQRVFADADLLDEVDRFVATVLAPGRVNALSQKLLQLSMPGVPDVYQGSELWELSLVDPDNRRPVDFGLRRSLLDRLDGAAPLPPLADDEAGSCKLRVVTTALRLRRDFPEAFAPGAAYEPLEPRGAAAAHAVAFVRGGRAVSVATRLPVGLARSGGWRDTVVPLPPGEWTDALTGRGYQGELALANALTELPVALLVRR